MISFDELLAFGLPPSSTTVPTIRALLDDHAALERASQGDGDTEVMRLAAAQLFMVGDVDDVTRIWRAKQSSFDASFAIDIGLLCGAGVEQTLAHLDALGDDGAKAAAAVRQLEDFDVDEFAEGLQRYYGD